MTKPLPWNWSPHLLAPEYRDIASRTLFLLPYWEGRGAGMPIDLIKGLRGTPSANPPDWSATEAGVALKFDFANFETLDYGTNPSHWVDYPGVFWYGAPNDNSTTARVVFEIPYQGSEPYYSISLRYNDGTTWERHATVQWNQGGTRYSFGGALRNTDAIMPQNKMSTWLVSIKENAQRNWVNGKLTQERTETGVVTYNNQITAVNKAVHVGQYATAHHGLLMLVAGGFTQAEAALLSSDPYGIIRHYDPIEYFAGQGVTINAPLQAYVTAGLIPSIATGVNIDLPTAFAFNLNGLLPQIGTGVIVNIPISSYTLTGLIPAFSNPSNALVINSPKIDFAIANLIPEIHSVDVNELLAAELDLTPPFSIEQRRWLFKNFLILQSLLEEGFTGQFTTTDGKTVHVRNGIIIDMY